MDILKHIDLDKFEELETKEVIRKRRKDDQPEYKSTDHNKKNVQPPTER
jgi:hypothetical protein